MSAAVSVVVSGSGNYIRTYDEHEWGVSGMPDTTVEPSGGVMRLIHRKTDEGRCLLENPSEMLMKAALLMLLCPAAQVLWFGSHVMFSTCGLQTASVVL